ncbi:alcohol dehydrogenase-like 7 [Zingiber officinale]|uniref:alcohol dehydrogenase-like 7 n=1 Tax=Zingiber officinale TaxID=94328 RepID=UPI001C4D6AC7|nr:alcohol dehydrogenase-like 7 [Zingiber officinale]
MEMPFPEPIRCKAAVCRSAGEPLLIEEVVVAPPRAHEVRVKIICSSLCFSDVSRWRLREFPAVFPTILGHEAIGVVESVGEEVEEVAAGDTVMPVFLADCRDCVDCRSERSNMCSRLPFRPLTGMPRDGTTRFTDAAGAPVYHYLTVSSFSQYTVVDVTNVVKVSAELPPEKICVLSCGFSTGFGAAWKVANVDPGSTVAVFGLGTIGLAVVEGARLQGAGRIIGVDSNPDKFEVGKRLGLTDFINPNDIGHRSINEVIKEMTDGGADYCFECIGLASVMLEAYRSSRSGWGKTVILGVEKNMSPITIDSKEILCGKTIIGSAFGGLKSKTHIPILIDKYLNKELHLDEFVTHEVGLDEINKAFELLIEGKCIRCVIWMDK